jgi:hypothetical protein
MHLPGEAGSALLRLRCRRLRPSENGPGRLLAWREGAGVNARASEEISFGMRVHEPKVRQRGRVVWALFTETVVEVNDA